MFVFTCPVIARSQCWLFALRANFDICPQISIFDPRIELPVTVQWCKPLHVKVQGNFNQINLFQNIGITFK